MISKFFIDRPRFALVISTVIMLAGLVAIFSLPVTQYPDITPSQISVSTTYPGADALTTQNSVIEPLESQINGVKRMLYMSSIASDAGSADITVTFGIGTDGDLNTVNVQNRVNLGTAQLPAEVKQNTVSVKEKSSNMLLIITLFSPNGTHDAIFLSNYLSLYVKDEISRISGVSDIQMLGDMTFGMRLWLDPEKLAARGLTVGDVQNALTEQNVPVAAGSLGAMPAPDNQISRMAVQTRGYLLSPEEFADIVLKALPDGQIVKVGDVATVERGSATYDMVGQLDGKPSALLAIYQLNDANGIQIAEQCRAKMDDLKKSFPSDLDYGIQYDTTAFVEASISEVVVTLFEALVLVVLVTYIFLQNWRDTLVPVVAIPVSLVGTFAVLLVIGYTINLITLFGLILAIGVVVDDAIVVVENVNRLMTQNRMSPRDAAIQSMEEVTGPVIATTAVLLAMFVPVCFLSGITGEIYRQFGITVSVAVAISSINALTLSPALAATMFRLDESGHRKFFLFRWFDAGFDWITRMYGHTVRFCLKRVAIMLLFYGGLVFLCGWLYNRLPAGFIPNEDQGIFFVNVQLPDGAALPRTQKTVNLATEKLLAMPGVQNVIAAAGYNILSGVSSSNNAMLIVVLKPWDQRTTPELSQTAILMRAAHELAQIPDGLLQPFPVSPIPGLGTSGGFSFVLEDTNGTNADRMQKTLNQVLGEANDATKHPMLSNVFTTFRSAVPQIYLNIDREKVMKLGVSMLDVNQALQGLLGYVYVNDYPQFGKLFRVEVQATDFYRLDQDAFTSIFVRNKKGEMVPLNTLMTISKTFAPQYLTRYNRYSSATLNGDAAAGYSSGQAMAAMEEIGSGLPDGFKFDWTDISYQEKLAAGQLPVIITLALLFIYLFLVAQYESWVIPLAVIASVPVAFFGALLFLWLGGVENNLYTQVGFILLFGIACKTAILIVEFAKVKHDEDGMSCYDAAVEAANLRFRAVLMTAISFVLGTMPLVIAIGPGAVSRRSLGTAVFGGMTVAAILGTIMIPAFYLVFQRLIDWVKKPERKPAKKAVKS